MPFFIYHVTGMQYYPPRARSATGKPSTNGDVGSHSQVLGESLANLTLPDCVRVARFYRELSFAPNQGLGEYAKMGPLRAMTLCFGTFVLGSAGTLFL